MITAASPAMTLMGIRGGGGKPILPPPDSKIEIKPDFTCVYKADGGTVIEFANQSSVTIDDVKVDDYTVSWDFGDKYNKEANSSTLSDTSHKYLLAGDHAEGSSDGVHKVSLSVAYEGYGEKTEKECRIPLRFTGVQAFQNSSYLQRNDGAYFAFGSNKQSKLGKNYVPTGTNKDDNVTTPTKIAGLPPILYLELSRVGQAYGEKQGEYSFLGAGVSPDRKTIYYWGAFNSDKLLVKRDDPKTCPNPIEGTDSICSITMTEEQGKIVSVKTGNSYALIESDNGKLYAFGRNDFGQLGIGKFAANEEPSLAITEVKLPITATDKLDFYETLENYSYASIADKLYGWGLNTGESSQNAKNYLQIDTTDENEKKKLHTPKRVLLPSGKSDADFSYKSIVLGSNAGSEGKVSYTTALASDGKMYSWGNNFRHMRGTGGDSGSEGTPSEPAKEAVVDQTATITSIKTCYLSLAFDKASSNFYAWGGEGKFIGVEEKLPYDGLPAKVVAEGVKFTEDFFVGNDVAYAFDESGDVWSWGLNTGVAFGYANSLAKGFPLKIDPGADVKFDSKAFAAGRDFVITLDKSHDNLYVWGSNEYGQLGLGEPSLKQQELPSKIDLKQYLTK